MSTAHDPSAALAEAVMPYTPTLADIIEGERIDLEESRGRYEPMHRSEDERFAEWFTRELSRIEADRAAAWARYQSDLSTLKARRSALVWHFGTKFIAVVDALRGVKKGVQTGYRWCGWKKHKPSLEVIDQEAACAWAIAHDCIDAIDMRIGRKTPLLEHALATEIVCKGTGEVTHAVPDGCRILPERDEFEPALVVDKEHERILREEDHVAARLLQKGTNDGHAERQDS